jgi:spermidine synthase
VNARWLAAAGLFLISGAAALVVETTWQRWFRELLGATAPATAATLVAFFGGQALGALAGARLASSRSNRLALYAGLELAAAMAALYVLPALALGEALLGSVYDSLQTSPGGLTSLRFGLAILASLPAALCYGATLPVMTAALVPRAPGLGRRGTLLYGLNLLGAAGGALLASLVLPEHIGVPATYGVGIGLSLVACVGALLLSRGPAIAVATRPPAVARAAPARPEVSGPRLEALAFLSGFGALALQVLLVHCFAQVLNQSLAAFGVVLVTVLATLALGALGVAAIERSSRIPPAGVLSVASAVAALSLAAFPALLVQLTEGLRYVGSPDPWPGYLTASLGLVVTSTGIPLLAVGLVFPLTLALAGAGRPETPVARLVGRLAAVNTLGAVAGALVASFVLLPGLGPWLPFPLLGLLYAIACMSVRLPGMRLRLWRDLALGLGWIAVLTRASPLGLPIVNADPESILAIETTPAGAVAVIRRDGERLIQIDNHYALGGSAEQVHEERQGHLPLLLAPNARSVAYLGSATGISAGASMAHPVERLVLVELVPGVSRMAERFFRDSNRAVYEDPRTEVVLDDARSFVRQSRAPLDLVVADLFVPWRAGTAALYSGEHFAAIRALLSEHGMLCQWLPLYQLSEQEFWIIAATFLDVFPDALLFRGDFYGRFPIVALVGWRGAPPAPEAVDRAIARLREAGVTDRWMTDAAGFWAHYVGPLAPLAADLGSVPRQSDARPVLEFLTARGHAGGNVGKRDPFVGLAWARSAVRILEAGRASGDPFLPRLSEESRRAVGGGTALQLAGALYVEDDLVEASRALAVASELLPARLFQDAEADPTAAEVWHSD